MSDIHHLPLVAHDLPPYEPNVPPEHGEAPDPHVYLSTGCRHGHHRYCQSDRGAAGTKIPAVCKFCKAPCICWCHKEKSAG